MCNPLRITTIFYPLNKSLSKPSRLTYSGTYDVVYEVYDHEGNMSSTIIVYVKDLEDPKVELKVRLSLMS